MGMWKLRGGDGGEMEEAKKCEDDVNTRRALSMPTARTTASTCVCGGKQMVRRPAAAAAPRGRKPALRFQTLRDVLRRPRAFGFATRADVGKGRRGGGRKFPEESSTSSSFLLGGRKEGRKFRVTE